LDGFMAWPVLDRPRVVAIVGQLRSSGSLAVFAAVRRALLQLIPGSAPTPLGIKVSLAPLWARVAAADVLGAFCA